MEYGLEIGLPFLFAFGGIALILWAQGNADRPKPKKTVCYQIAYNGTNFLWLSDKDSDHSGFLHFDKKPKKSALDYDGVWVLDHWNHKCSIAISSNCEVEQALQKFIEANW